MSSPYFNYLIERVRNLEQLLEKSNPKAGIGSHIAKFDHLFDEVVDEQRAKLKGLSPGRPKINLIHFQYADTTPDPITYEDAARITGYALSTLRNRISQSPNKAVIFYRQGRHQVIAKDEDGADRELRRRFSDTGNPDDLIRLSPRGKF